MVMALVKRQQTYRANIMFLDPRDNMLKIAVHYNMERNISLPPNVGCSGTALQRDSEAFYDPRILGTMGIDQDRVWRELKSIISMPIHDSNGARLGVLNMDSDRPIENSGFYDEDFKGSMRLAADAFGKFLEKEV
jgi:hypothetical protein